MYLFLSSVFWPTCAFCRCLSVKCERCSRERPHRERPCTPRSTPIRTPRIRNDDDAANNQSKTRELHYVNCSNKKKTNNNRLKSFIYINSIHIKKFDKSFSSLIFNFFVLSLFVCLFELLSAIVGFDYLKFVYIYRYICIYIIEKYFSLVFIYTFLKWFFILYSLFFFVGWIFFFFFFFLIRFRRNFLLGKK